MYNQTYIQIGDQKIKVEKGVIQGGILSPKLFAIFYDTLLDKIENAKYFMCVYADDIVLAFHCKRDIKRAIKLIEDWASDYRMSFNQNKTKLLFHT